MARTSTRNDQPDENPEQAVEVMSDSRRRRHNAAAGGEVGEQAVTRKDRPTPSARQAKPKSASTGLVSRIPVVRGVVGYFRGVISELKKVTWPDRDETVRLTTVVLAVTIAFAIALGILNTFFSWWFQQAFHPDSEIVFMGVGAVVLVVAGAAFGYFRARI